MNQSTPSHGGAGHLPSTEPGAGLTRIRSGVDRLVDEGLALDVLVAAVMYVVSQLAEFRLPTTVVSIWVVTMASKRVRRRLELLFRRHAKERSRKWWMLGIAGCITFLEEAGGRLLRDLLAKLHLSSGQAAGTPNTGAIALQAASAAAASVMALGGGAAVAAVVPQGGPTSEIVAFGAEAELDATERFNRQATPAVPADAVEPGGTIQACDPLYLVDYIAYENMEEGMAVVVRVTVDGKAFATTRERWNGPAEETQARATHVGTGDVSNGQPVPYGRWTLAVEVDGDIRDEATVTLERACRH